MPLRRRRDGTAVQARTEEPSSARVRVSSWQKAPWLFRRWHPSRGVIKEEPKAGANGDEVLQTSSPVEPATRVPEASREGHARHRSRARGSPLLERLDPRFAPSTQVERPVRKPVRGGSRLAGLRGGNASWDQRNRHRLVPASSGAKAPLACEDRTLVGCARASFSGCRSRQATPRLREACLPLATGRVDGSPTPPWLERNRGGAKRRREPASRWPSCEAGEFLSRALERALRGKGSCQTEGISDHSSSSCRSRDRAEGGLGGFHGCAGRASDVTPGEEATGMPEGRTARIATGRQRPPR